MPPNQKPINVTSLIDNRPISKFQIWVIFLCSFVVLLDGYDIQTMALTVPILMAEWDLERGSFTWALTAAIIGMAAGYAFLAPLGDRFGRRPIMIVGMALVGIASIITAFSTTPTDLIIWRAITGIGLGASLPNATALTSEYVPIKQRAFLISLMFCSVALGALIAGFVAPALIETLGWRSIFMVGGVIPLTICVLLLVNLPESIQFLSIRNPSDRRIFKILHRIAPEIDSENLESQTPKKQTKPSAQALLAPEFRARTILLWIIFVFNLYVLYVLISWLPVILKDSGWSDAWALRGAVSIQAGGIVGGLLMARLVDKGKTVPALLVGYVITAITFGLFSVIENSIFAWFLMLLIIGAGVSGAQVAITTLSAIFYPPSIRATGAGWANVMGRMGAIAGPLVAGKILFENFQVSPVGQLLLLIPPILICATGVYLLPRAWKG